MKKILSLLFAAMLSTAAWAVKAYPFPVVITQVDGTQLTIVAHGDSKLSWFTTTDGTLLCRQDGAFYVAAIDDEGMLKPTDQLAHEPNLRQARERQLVAQQDRSRFHQAAETLVRKAMRREPVNASGKDIRLFPHAGSPRVLVILAQFSDTTRVDILNANKEVVDQIVYQPNFVDSDPKAVFEEYLNGTSRPLEALGDATKGTLSRNIGSVSRYFSDQSFGQFTPGFDIYGPVTVPGKLRKYGKDNSAKNRDQMSSFVPDVCQAANEQCPELDFSQYDADGDGYVDLVYIIYAGYSQSFPQNDDICIWPKSGATTSSKKFDGKLIYRYGVNNELNAYPGANPSVPYYMNGIGLFCHEFSHTMGLPDIYPAHNDDARVDNQAMEYWSLMDGGEYITNGWAPAAYTAWEREAMGWMEIQTLEETTLGIEMSTIERDQTAAYRIYNPYDTNKRDYYVVQNIQQRNWNMDQKGHGMLVYHVNYDKDLFSLSSNKVNDDLGYPRMTVVPADGRLFTSYNVDNKTIFNADYYKELAGDPFPGTDNVTQLSDDNRLPNFAPWLGDGPKTDDGTRLLGKVIANISEDEETGIVTFDFFGSKDDYANGIKDISSNANANAQGIHSLSGVQMGNRQTLPPGIYIIDRKKVLVK